MTFLGHLNSAGFSPMSLDHLIKLLKTGSVYTNGTWVLVMGGRNGGLDNLREGLNKMSISVHNADTVEAALQIIENCGMPPVLAYMFAEGLGGLEHAITLHAELQKVTHIGKCLIVSPEAAPDINFSSVDSTSPLILSAPKRTRLN